MYPVTDAHPLTILIVMASMLVTPFFVLATYVFSGASARKGVQIGAAFLVFGAVMFWVCLSDAPRRLGMLGEPIVPIAWIAPTLILFLKKDWFVSQPLSQKWLVGLQLFRAIGGVFLIEMTRGYVPAVFAYPAGLGDIVVALIALAVLLKYRNAEIPRGAVLLVIVVGVADFISAFFFGFTSSETPVQLFFPDPPSKLIMFPTGMIPLFLVPYAIFFHGLSWLSLKKASTEGRT